MAHGDGIGKDDGVRNDDLTALFGRHDSRPRLYVGDVPLDSCNAGESTEFRKDRTAASKRSGWSY
jgi:hypothetical protein